MSEINKVLFVCLGNTCRSPMAECILKDLVPDKSKWIINSAALENWHAGSQGDPRMKLTLKNHDLSCEHTARQITQQDFRDYDYIFGMDDYNIEYLNAIKPSDSKAKIILLGSFDPNGETIIEDPYCDRTLIIFEKCFEQITRSSNGFLASLEQNIP